MPNGNERKYLSKNAFVAVAVHRLAVITHLNTSAFRFQTPRNCNWLIHFDSGSSHYIVNLLMFHRLTPDIQLIRI